MESDLNRTLRFAALLVAVTVAGILVGAIWRMPAVHSTNDASRWNTVWSLTHGEGYAIGDYPWPTNDRVKRTDNDKWYSSKPTLLPTVLAGYVWLFRAATGMDLPADDKYINRSALFLLNVAPLALFVLLFDRLIASGGHSAETRLFCLVSAAFGTYLSGYTVTLNNHTVSALGVFFSLYCLIQIVYEGRRHWGWFAGCGALAAWAVVNEQFTVFYALAAFVWLMARDWRRTLLFGLPPALVVVAALLVTTKLALGSWVPFQLQKIVLGHAVHLSAPGYWKTPIGIDALEGKESRLFYLFNFTFGHHGFFSLTPLFLVSLFGFLRKSRLAAVTRLGLALSVVALIYYVARTDNYGGSCNGPRWFIWLMPFWLLALAPAVERCRGSRLFWALAFAALFVSLVSVGDAITGAEATEASASGPWGASWLHRLFRGAGIVDY